MNFVVCFIGNRSRWVVLQFTKLIENWGKEALDKFMLGDALVEIQMKELAQEL